MWNKFRQLMGDQDDQPLRDFEADTAHLQDPQYEKLGTLSIPVAEIIGSVGRAHELNSRFHYRQRHLTDRYHSMQARTREGVPMEPIRVIEFEGKYYVVDGHHRVAQAIKDGSTHINAKVTRLTDAPTS